MNDPIQMINAASNYADQTPLKTEKTSGLKSDFSEFLRWAISFAWTIPAHIKNQSITPDEDNAFTVSYKGLKIRTRVYDIMNESVLSSDQVAPTNNRQYYFEVKS